MFFELHSGLPREGKVTLMSLNAIELVLWTVTTSETEAARYRNDPAAFLERFRVDAAETADIVHVDVRALGRRGVNEMLLFAFFQRVRGRAFMGEYLGAMGAA
jgi:protocatechuate 4,5-dioxygenase alpha chain